MNDPIMLAITLEVQTSGEAPAEELAWLLNLIRCELATAKGWKGKVRRVQFDRSPARL